MTREEEEAVRMVLHDAACDIADAATRLVIIAHDAHTETLRIAVEGIIASVDLFLERLRDFESRGLR